LDVQLSVPARPAQPGRGREKPRDGSGDRAALSRGGGGAHGGKRERRVDRFQRGSSVESSAAARCSGGSTLVFMSRMVMRVACAITFMPATTAPDALRTGTAMDLMSTSIS